jgi:hypothetical protein
MVPAIPFHTGDRAVFERILGILGELVFKLRMCRHHNFTYFEGNLGFLITPEPQHSRRLRLFRALRPFLIFGGLIPAASSGEVYFSKNHKK